MSPDNREKITREQAEALAAQYQEQVMKMLFGVLKQTGPTISVSLSPTTNTNTDEKETDSRLN